VVDIVSVATPPSSHAEIAIAALKHGVHVLIEKPIATAVADAQAILDAQDESSAVATVNFMLRFNPIIAAIHGWCRSGVFGALQRVVVENYAQDETLGPNHWFWDNVVSGGILVEHGVHFFDIVNGCTTARVSRVTHRSWSRHPKMEDRVFALVEYDDGLVASHYHAFNRIDEFERTSIRFVFDAAQVEVEGWIPMQGRVMALTSDDARTAGAGRTALDALPNLELIEERPLDASRNTPLTSATLSQAKVDTITSATFRLDGSKEDAYLAALRALMTDMIQSVRNPNPVLRVSLEDGIEALRVALGETGAGFGSNS
jgi:predicted dehydrogenase